MTPLRGSMRRQAGFTLLEVVLAIVIIALASTTIVGVMSATANRSSASMQEQQAAQIANAYLREALGLPFTDPAGADGESTRQSYDDVHDYAIDTMGAHDRTDVAISGLEGYRVQVSTRTCPALPFLAAAPDDCRSIVATVTTPAGLDVVLSAIKTKPP